MITEQTATIECDRGPTCAPAQVRYAGTETDHQFIEAALKDEGWIVTDLEEHICPACVFEYRSEQRELARERARDEFLDAPERNQAAWIMRGAR